MNNLMWLVRASQWVRRPPSAKMVKLVFGIIAVGIVLVVLEKLGLWPEWAVVEKTRRPL